MAVEHCCYGNTSFKTAIPTIPATVIAIISPHDIIWFASRAAGCRFAEWDSRGAYLDSALTKWLEVWQVQEEAAVEVKFEYFIELVPRSNSWRDF